MKLSDAIRSAWRTYTASFGDTLKYLLTELCLALICLAPLLFLSGGPAFLAWLAPVLWVLLRLPARINAAQAQAEALRGGALCSPRLVSFEGYGAKLCCGLKRVCFLILWAAPLIALGITGWTYFSGDVDGFTVLRMIRDLGGGDQMRGILMLAGALAAALLLLMVGCAFHSGARHAFAQGQKDLPRGHHGAIMGAWFASLAAVLPLIIAVIIALGRYLPALSDLNGLLLGLTSLPSTRDTLTILAVGALLTLPLLPLRSLIHAARMAQLASGAKEAVNS